MSHKKRTSLDTILSRAVDDPPPAASPTAPVSAPAAPAATLVPPRPQEPLPKTAVRRRIKHMAYLKPRIHEQLRRLAFEERRKMHDYLIEGLDSVFRSRGLPGIAELEDESQ